MGYWSLPHTGSKSTSTLSLVITAHADAHTKGSWVQFISSTTYPGFLSYSQTSASQNYRYLTDIAIGAEGSEVVIASNLIFEWSASYGIATGIAVLPILIPAGQRISLRTQCHVAGSKILVASLNYWSINSFLGHKLLSVMDTYGANTSSSCGTSIDPGTSAYTWGAWTEISASCTRNIKAIMFGAGNQLNTARGDYYHYFRLGAGANPNEVSIAEAFAMRTHMTTDMVTPQFSEIFPVSIPAGTRLSISSYCSGTDATDRLLDVILYTFS